MSKLLITVCALMLACTRAPDPELQRIRRSIEAVGDSSNECNVTLSHERVTNQQITHWPVTMKQDWYKVALDEFLETPR